MMGPIIELQVREMRHGIMEHLGRYHKDVEECVKKEMDEALLSFQIKNEVRKAVNEALIKSIKAYFAYGDGAKSIEKSICDFLGVDSDTYTKEEKP